MYNFKARLLLNDLMEMFAFCRSRRFLLAARINFQDFSLEYGKGFQTPSKCFPYVCMSDESGHVKNIQAELGVVVEK